MNESEKQPIMTARNKNCFKLLCLPHCRHRVTIIILIVLLTFIASLLAAFSLLAFYNTSSTHQLRKIVVETVSSDQDSVKFTCRDKRSPKSNAINRYRQESNDDDDDDDNDSDVLKNRESLPLVVSSNLFKRQTLDDDIDITDRLHERLEEVNKNRVHRRDLQNSIEKINSKLSSTENFLRGIEAEPVDDENALLIEKSLRDLSEEIDTLDDDIVSLLESSNLLDNTVRKRIRHRRETDSTGGRREKRLIQQKLEEVREEFVRCKKSADGTSKSEDCDKVYRRVMDRFREITKKFQEIEQIVSDMEVIDVNKKGSKSSEEKNSSEESGKKTTKKENEVTTSQTTLSTTKENEVTTSQTTTSVEATTSGLKVNEGTNNSTTTTTLATTKSSDATTVKIEEKDEHGDKMDNKIVTDGKDEHSTDEDKKSLREIKVKLQSALSLPASDDTTTCPASTPPHLTLPADIKKHPKFIEDLQDQHHLYSKLYEDHQSLSRSVDDRVFGIKDIMVTIKDLVEDGLDYAKHQNAHEDSKEVGAMRENSFTSLCHNLNSKNADTQPTTSHQPHPFMHVPFSGYYPMTGETSKATSKVVMNPGYNIMPYPVCFMQYPAPAAQQYRAPFFYPNVMPMPVINAPTGGNRLTAGGSYIPSEFIRDRAFFMPSDRPIQHPPVESGARETDSENKVQRTYCAFLPSDNANLPAYYEATTSTTAPPRSREKDDGNGDDYAPTNIPSQFDIIYATYPSQIFALNQSQSHHCDDGMLPCLNTNQCVAKSKWCDSRVDCIDASDETACSCKSRLERSRICDGFIDCPMGSDELGCFGCDRFQFSCFESRSEYESSSRSSLSCYSSLERCDGFDNCQNGRDERDCSMIVSQLGTVTSYFAPGSEGVLHRNHKGRWYPVCQRPIAWAYEACKSEVDQAEPDVAIKVGRINGPFIQPGERSDIDEVMFSDTCRLRDGALDNELENHLVYVKCKQPKCGCVSGSRRAKRQAEPEDDVVKQARIVGGVKALPMEFPFVVAIFKDGRFHCGGSIFNERWIITAGHCCRLFESHHYEVRAGFLRRSSFSPMTQITKVTHVIRHEDYDRATMKNDIALMRVQHHFVFNKWVRPICLPSAERTGVESWILGPRAGTMCSTLGWGSIREKGPEPDDLQIVEIPILSKCKHLSDEETESVCAGEAEGRKDACQGDSGGPLLCRSASNPSEWYLTGIVSHGEGCARANEPGVYTRTALYIDWIMKRTDPSAELPTNVPRSECPGMNCVWGGQKCISASSKCDGIVDCLGGEDEVDCPFNWFNIFTLGSAGKSGRDDIDPNSGEYGGMDDVRNMRKKALSSKMFRCKKISQFINIDLRCDKVFDCEDGTDEVNCTCREHLRGPFTKLICDGHVDCADKTDEIGCLSCSGSEFACPRSKKCISKSQQCDGSVDCKHAEDELYCLALTDGHSVTLDVNGKPHLHTKGIVARNSKSKWSIFCDDNGDFLTNATTMATDICHILGFRSQRNVRVVNMKSDDIREHVEVRASERINRDFVDGCLALEIECSPYAKDPHPPKNSSQHDAIVFVPVKHNSSILKPQPSLNVHLRDFEPPWNVEIFSNGVLAGTGLLLDTTWILTEQSVLGAAESNPLTRNHVVTIAGNSRAEVNIQSPYEQITRVDCMRVLNESNAMLLHLKLPIHFNRHVLPAFLPLEHEVAQVDETCMAIAQVSGMSAKSLKSLRLEASEGCGGKSSGDCYTASSDVDKDALCNDGYTPHRVATIVCRTATSSWYPKAFYPMSKGFCDFASPVAISSFGKTNVYRQIKEFIDNPTCEACIQHALDIPCSTHRCPLGTCLKPSQLCNQIADCHDASDESETICETVAHNDTCLHHEFQCRNKRCVDKSLFCNHVDNCGDKSDEPSECTCFNYLRLTNPSRLCDGIIHCYDRMDESVKYCGGKCDAGKFKCEPNSSRHCIPHESVCDGIRDCPNGADEARCYGAHEIYGSNGFYEVLKRTNGLWHTKCFPRSSPPSQEEVEKLCDLLGLRSADAQARARLKISSNGTDSGSSTLPIEFHDATNATKIVHFSKFSPTKISDDFSILIKPDKPLSRIVKWDKTDHENCYRLDISC